MENITLSRRAVFAIGAVFAALLLLVVFFLGHAFVATTTQSIVATNARSSTLTGTWLSLPSTDSSVIAWDVINAGAPGSSGGTLTDSVNGKLNCQSTDVRTYPSDSLDDAGTFTYSCGGAEYNGHYTPTTFTICFISTCGVQMVFNRATYAEYQMELKLASATPVPTATPFTSQLLFPLAGTGTTNPGPAFTTRSDWHIAVACLAYWATDSTTVFVMAGTPTQNQQVGSETQYACDGSFVSYPTVYPPGTYYIHVRQTPDNNLVSGHASEWEVGIYSSP